MDVLPQSIKLTRVKTIDGIKLKKYLILFQLLHPEARRN